MIGLTVAFTLSIGAMSAAIVHLIPYLTDHGWTHLHAAIAAGLIGATQVAARVVFGSSPSGSPPARLALARAPRPRRRHRAARLVEWRGDGLGGRRAARHRTGHHHAAAAAGAVQAAQPARLRSGAAQSAAWSTVARAVAPLLLAGSGRSRRRGYPIGFAVSVVIGIAGAIVAYRSLLRPPPALLPAFADTTR